MDKDQTAKKEETPAGQKTEAVPATEKAGPVPEKTAKAGATQGDDLQLKRAAMAIVQRASDDMRVTMQVTPPVGGGMHVNRDIIDKALHEKKVTFGIDEAVVNRIIDEQIYGQAMTVAVGEEPVNGDDAQLIFHYDKLIQRQDRSLDNLGQVNWKELGNIINTDPDVLLLEKIPPTEGTPGVTVTNKKTRQTKGKDLRIRSGKGARVDDSGLKWYAEIAGQVIFRNDQISVENVIEVEDVNAESGNVHFKGTVVVKGLVEDGFTVESTADLRVQGNVGAAKLIAHGDISIVGGIFGKQQAEIVSQDGSIFARFSQDARLIAAKDIVIDEYARNSDLKAAHSIRIVNENNLRGCLMGGSASAIEEIICNNVGTEIELPTKVVVGISKEDIDRTAALEVLLNKQIQNIDSLRKSMLTLQNEKRQHQGRLDPRKRELYDRFLEMLNKLHQTSHTDVCELLRLYHAGYSQKKCYLHVNNQIFPNVNISIKHASMAIQKRIEFATLTENEGEINVLPLMGHQDAAAKTQQ